jgi:thioredoxin-like negative regulator of GroEL
MARVVVSLSLALALTSTFACSSEPHDPARRTEFHLGAAPNDPSESQPRLLADPKPPPGVREDGSIVSAVDWFEGSIEQALAKAKAERKLVFVDVGAYWCPPCHELDEKVFTQPEFGEWLGQRMIAVHVDAEKGDGPELVERYRVQAYPTMLVLETSGVEKGRVVDFVEAGPLQAELAQIAEGSNTMAALTKAVQQAPEDLEARYRLAHAYTLAARREEADSVFVTLLAADPDNAKGYASKVIYDRAQFFTLKLDADPEQAIAELQALQTKFPDSAEARKAYRMIGRAHCKLDRTDEAVASLDAMIATDPADTSLKASYGWFAFRENCRPDAGLKAVLAGIEQDPSSAELRYLAAELHHLVGAPEAALGAIREASRLEPNSAYYKRQIRRFEAMVPGEPNTDAG